MHADFSETVVGHG